MKEHLSRAILIDVCKDKTLSYRIRKKLPFNKVAIPVFSVNTFEEARRLILLVGRKQYDPHPQLPADQPWFKVTLDGALDFKQYLEITDLEAVTEKLQKSYRLIMGELTNG